MGVNALTAEEIRKHVPCRILSLGFPDHLHGNVDLKGSELVSVDIIAHHGSEILIDLSERQFDRTFDRTIFEDLGEFDLVLDCGTLEHCANIANGFLNAAFAVKPGGRILHELPLNMTNHGYWNICPVWFTDFYAHNGFIIERMDMHLNGGYHEAAKVPWPGGDPNVNMFIVQQAALTFCVARRTNNNPITLPKCQEQWLNE